MDQIPNKKQYDLEDRCLKFAARVNEYVRKLPKDIPNGANYIEANESSSKKDFLVRVKISKKEKIEICNLIFVICLEFKY